MKYFSSMLYIFLCFQCFLKASSYLCTKTPSMQPLQYIDIPALGEALVETTKDAVFAFILPQTFNDAAASIISSGVSGFIAGLVVSAVATLDGNTNFKDPKFIFAGTSGFYFATRSTVDTIGEIVGMSTPLVNVFAIVVPVIVSELFKLRAKAISEQQTRVGKGPTMYELMRFDNPTIKDIMQFRENEKNGKDPKMRKPMLAKVTQAELVSDVTKWFSFSLLNPLLSGVPFIGTVEAGAVAGLVSQLVREREDSAAASSAGTYSSRVLRCLRATLEGSFQFLTYDLCKKYLFGFSG